MKRKYVITNEKLKKLTDKNSDCYLVSALLEDQKLTEVNCFLQQNTSLLNNIYIGRVQNVVSNLHAAFVEIQKGVLCYLSLEDLEHPVFTKKISSKAPIVQGDELLVQISKEAIKTKNPMVTTNISITGVYAVVTSGNQVLGVSAKLPKARRAQLKESMTPFCIPGQGLVIRTNAATASDEQIQQEVEMLQKKLQELLLYAQGKTHFSCLYQAPPEYLTFLQNQNLDELDEIVTDLGDVYRKLTEYAIAHQRSLLPKLVFYQDSMLDLGKLYNLEGQIENALKPKVWLKSGANLMIEPTEALTVIDVNSGKNVAKASKQDNISAINQEAAIEIMKQLRLRNISGICIIDFIDMKKEENQQQLLELLKNLARKDSVRTDILDITELGLVELTRKKVHKSLLEQVKKKLT